MKNKFIQKGAIDSTLDLLFILAFLILGVALLLDNSDTLKYFFTSIIDLF